MRCFSVTAFHASVHGPLAGEICSRCVVNVTTRHVEYLVWKNIMAFDVEKIGRGNHSIGESVGHVLCLPHSKTSMVIRILNDCCFGEWIFRHKEDLHGTQPLLLRGILFLFCFHPIDAKLIFVYLCGPLSFAILKTLSLEIYI